MIVASEGAGGARRIAVEEHAALQAGLVPRVGLVWATPVAVEPQVATIGTWRRHAFFLGLQRSTQRCPHSTR